MPKSQVFSNVSLGIIPPITWGRIWLGYPCPELINKLIVLIETLKHASKFMKMQ